MDTYIEQIARFHRAWERRHIDYALQSLEGVSSSHLGIALAAWTDGLAQRGWTYQQAAQFTGDMLLVKKGRRHHGPLRD